MNIGAPEVLVVLVIALIVLGPKRLPEAARSLGKAMNELKKVTNDVQNEFREAVDLTPEPPAISGDVDLTKTSDDKTTNSES